MAILQRIINIPAVETVALSSLSAVVAERTYFVETEGVGIVVVADILAAS